MKYYIIAGEASGDLHASNLIKELKVLDSSAEFRCWGGDQMEAQGAELVKHYRDLAFMGFIEVAANIKTILNNIKFCKKDILEYKPDAVILVDYPGFNLRIAEFAHNAGFKVFYYISPQVWAWKKSRVHKIKKFVDRMFVILPFEKDFYLRYNYDVDFVGHPLLDMIGNISPHSAENFLAANGFDNKRIVALLPGSRKQEIKIVLPLMLSVVENFKNYRFVIAGAPSIEKEFYNEFITSSNVDLIEGQTYNLLQNSYAAIVTSGTATLETALFDVPEVVCYKGSYISYQIARRVIDKSVIKFISLVNLISDKEVVTELIQNECTSENIGQELQNITVDNSKRKRILNEYKILKEKLGGIGASKRTAEKIHKLLHF